MPFKILGYLFHCEPFSDIPSRPSLAQLFTWSSEQVIVPWHSILLAAEFKNSPQSCLYLQHIFTLVSYSTHVVHCVPRRSLLWSQKELMPLHPLPCDFVIFNIPIMAPNTLYWNFLFRHLSPELYYGFFHHRDHVYFILELGTWHTLNKCWMDGWMI